MTFDMLCERGKARVLLLLFLAIVAVAAAVAHKFGCLQAAIV